MLRPTKQLDSGFLAAMLLSAAACGTDSPAAPSAGHPVAAAAPTTSAFQVPYAFEADCSQGFLLTNTGIASGHQTIFTDAAGVPVRSQLHLALRGTIVNMSSGASLTNRSDLTVTTDLLTGESTVSGGQFHLVATGQGIVVLDAGTIRFDAEGLAIFEGGRHDFIDADFEAQECAALS